MRCAATVGLIGWLLCGGAAQGDSQSIEARVDRVLRETPLIDGHNDLPYQIRGRFHGDLGAVNLLSDTRLLPHPAPIGCSPPALCFDTETRPALMTDIPRLRAGRLGAQFWVSFVPVSIQGVAAVQAGFEQIDFIKRMCARYPHDFEMAYTAEEVRRIYHSHKIACLIGIEGGHQINDSLAVLRQMYTAGARYMSLTHITNTDWADSATDYPAHHGLTPFGEEVVHEMNRLGMLVDLSHVSPETMRAALAVSEAPVIFSHSSARALVDHPRNVPDDVLRSVGAKGGVVMVMFAQGYISNESNNWEADYSAEQARLDSSPNQGGLYIGQRERAQAALTEWHTTHPRPVATLAQVADHIDHVREVAGIDHVGIGSDFDGLDEDAPAGLEGVDKLPALLAELARRGWTDADLAKVASANVLRVLAEAERVSLRLQASRPASPMLCPSAKSIF